MQKGALGLPASPHWRCDSSQRERTQRQPSAGSAEDNQSTTRAEQNTYSYLGTAGIAVAVGGSESFTAVPGTVLRCYSS